MAYAKAKSIMKCQHDSVYQRLCIERNAWMALLELDNNSVVKMMLSACIVLKCIDILK